MKAAMDSTGAAPGWGSPGGSGAAAGAAERIAGLGQCAATSHSAMEPAGYRRERSANDSVLIRLLHRRPWERPDAAETARRIAKFAADCADELGPVTEVVWSGRGK